MTREEVIKNIDVVSQEPCEIRGDILIKVKMVCGPHVDTFTSQYYFDEQWECVLKVRKRAFAERLLAEMENTK